MSDVIIETTSAAVNIEVSGVGPRGPKGETGESGGNSFLLDTNSAIGGNRAIGTVGGYAVYADSQAGVIAVGVTKSAVTAGNPVTVQSGGKMTVTGAGWTPGEPVFLNTNGTLTQSQPATGISQVIGTAHSADVLLIEIARPINLI